jgi:hypothetical protein
VDERLRSLEPLAWNFVYEFAHDNQLRTTERRVDALVPATESSDPVPEVDVVPKARLRRGR